jgi:N-acetylglucosaminyl-diphospho-decaprenol L-rhamnosyltransferase
MMDLSIVIVNWNSIEFLKECITSIQSTTEHLDYEVIVVDNASADDPSRILAEEFSWVKLIRSDHNIGFARANNLGAKHSCGNSILFLNPDTLIIQDAICRMVLQLDSDPQIGAVGCRLLNRDLTTQMSCVQSFPGLINQILGIDWLRRRWPDLSIWGTRALSPENLHSINDVDAVSGACIMVKREVFEKVGGFSTEYFMYAEEIDLCCKIHSAGWKIRYVGDAEIVHYGGQSTKKQGTGFADVMMRESIFKFFRKFRGTPYAWLYRVSLLLSATARMMILAPLLALPNDLTAPKSARAAFLKWRKIASWALSMQRWTQQFGKSPPV